MIDTLIRPKAPLLKDLKKVFIDPRTLQAVEDLFEAVPQDLNEIIDEINILELRVEVNEFDIAALDVRVTELEPNYIPIDSTDSPYQAANNDYLLVDVNGGDVIINFPADGRFWVSRKGDPNDLTLNETVSGDLNPLILFDQSTAGLFKVGTEWRWGA